MNFTFHFICLVPEGLPRDLSAAPADPVQPSRALPCTAQDQATHAHRQEILLQTQAYSVTHATRLYHSARKRYIYSVRASICL